MKLQQMLTPCKIQMPKKLTLTQKLPTYRQVKKLGIVFLHAER
jgi:hypothetical protein